MNPFKLVLLGLFLSFTLVSSAADMALRFDGDGLTIIRDGNPPVHLVGEGMKSIDLPSGGTVRVSVVAAATGYRCLEVMTTSVAQFDALAQSVSLEPGGSFRATIVEQAGRPNLDVTWDGATVVPNSEKIDADAVVRFFSKPAPEPAKKVSKDQSVAEWPGVKGLKDAREALHAPKPPDDSVSLSLSDLDLTAPPVPTAPAPVVLHDAPAARSIPPAIPSLPQSTDVMPPTSPATLASIKLDPRVVPVAVTPPPMPPPTSVPATPAPSTPTPPTSTPVPSTPSPATPAPKATPKAKATPTPKAPPKGSPAPHITPVPATPVPKPIPTPAPIPTPPPRVLAMKPGDTRIPPGYVVERIGDSGVPHREEIPQETTPNLSVLRIDYPAAANPSQGIEILGGKPKATPPPATPDPKKKKIHQ